MVYGPKHSNIQTSIHMHVQQCSHASVGLTQVRPNKLSYEHHFHMAFEHLPKKQC